MILVLRICLNIHRFGCVRPTSQDVVLGFTVALLVSEASLGTYFVLYFFKVEQRVINEMKLPAESKNLAPLFMTTAEIQQIIKVGKFFLLSELSID